MKRPQKLAVMLVPTPPYEICGIGICEIEFLRMNLPRFHALRVSLLQCAVPGAGCNSFHHIGQTLFQRIKNASKGHSPNCRKLLRSWTGTRKHSTNTAGLIIGENGAEIELLLTAAIRQTIKKDTIAGPCPKGSLPLPMICATFLLT